MNGVKSVKTTLATPPVSAGPVRLWVNYHGRVSPPSPSRAPRQTAVRLMPSNEPEPNNNASSRSDCRANKASNASRSASNANSRASSKTALARSASPVTNHPGSVPCANRPSETET